MKIKTTCNLDVHKLKLGKYPKEIRYGPQKEEVEEHKKNHFLKYFTGKGKI